MSRSRALLIAALVLAGCYRDFPLVPPPGRDAGPLLLDAGPTSDAGSRPDASWSEPVGPCAQATPVDLLFVIDSSASMGEEQASLVAQLPRLLGELVQPPDRDGDGVPDRAAIPDLQVGVITTDMGSAGYPVPTCDAGRFGAMFGDDGVLRSSGNTGIPGCAAAYPSVLRFAGGDPAGFIDDVACVSSVGTGGCGFEQPLEAALKALSPSRPQSYTGPAYDPPSFFAGTFGQGEANGLVRSDSLLAVVVLTDEEDCSVSAPELLDPSSPRYGPVDLNLRCFSYPEALHPVERYVDGLLALRSERPDLFAFALIGGIPVESAVARPEAEDFDRILAHPDMQERVDPESPTRLSPSCNVPGRGLAFPPRRLVRVAAGIGPGRSTVQSICQDDFTGAVTPIVDLIARRACASREVP